MSSVNCVEPIEFQGFTLDEALPWHEDSWRQITRYVLQQKVPHALIITGHVGVGKTLMALQVARFLLCEAADKELTGCGRCGGCQLFEAHTHPDFITITPWDENKKPLPVSVIPTRYDRSITVDAIRQLIESLSLKPHCGGYRVVLLTPAHKLNRAAANSLLKTLEEPVDGTVMLLVTDRPSDLPATILSRCQRLVIRRPAARTALSWLRSNSDDDQIETLLALANGGPMQALRLSQDGSLEQRNKLFQSLGEVARKEADPIAVTEQWAKVSSEKVIEWLSGWVIDLIRLRHGGVDSRLNNPDWRDSLHIEAHRLRLYDLHTLLASVLNAQRALSTQINKQLMFERLLIEWRQLPRVPTDERMIKRRVP